MQYEIKIVYGKVSEIKTFTFQNIHKNNEKKFVSSIVPPRIWFPFLYFGFEMGLISFSCYLLLGCFDLAMDWIGLNRGLTEGLR